MKTEEPFGDAQPSIFKMVMGRKGKTLFSSDSKLARANWNESKIARLGWDQMPGFSRMQR
jgi:hypothetical protein